MNYLIKGLRWEIFASDYHVHVFISHPCHLMRQYFLPFCSLTSSIFSTQQYCSLEASSYQFIICNVKLIIQTKCVDQCPNCNQYMKKLMKLSNYCWKNAWKVKETRNKLKLNNQHKNIIEYFLQFRIMSELHLYKPKSCAFHPKQLIFNFCKNPECLLPLCPTCIKVHTDEHRAEKTYGQFENINKVVSDLSKSFDMIIKELKNCQEEMKEQQIIKEKEQTDLKKRIAESKGKMLVIVERFFSDFEKQVSKSIICYNESMKESNTKIEQHINLLTQEIEQKVSNLGTEKVLRTLIGYHARNEDERYWKEIQSIQNTIAYLQTQKVEVVCQSSATQNVIDGLGNYIHLSFQNWENEVKYGSQFVKTGFMSTGSDGFERQERNFKT